MLILLHMIVGLCDMITACVTCPMHQQNWVPLEECSFQSKAAHLPANFPCLHWRLLFWEGSFQECLQCLSFNLLCLVHKLISPHRLQGFSLFYIAHSWWAMHAQPYSQGSNIISSLVMTISKAETGSRAENNNANAPAPPVSCCKNYWHVCIKHVLMCTAVLLLICKPAVTYYLAILCTSLHPKHGKDKD